MMRRFLKPLVASVAVAVIGLFAMHVYALDGLEGCCLRMLLGDDTQYAKGYTDAGFRHITVGMPASEVTRTLGAPLGEVWVYDETPHSLRTVDFEGEQAVHIDPALVGANILKVGATKEVVLTALGAPRTMSLVYSRSPHDRSYRVRVVELARGRVIQKTASFYAD